MTKAVSAKLPADHRQRQQALDPTRSILVQAPAGSGKTTLLTQRFLTLLATVDDPGQVVAITFTLAAAAEMRNRILDELASAQPTPLAWRVLERSEALGWELIDLPAQLRISTIDAFCRDLATQQPLLSGLGGDLAIATQKQSLYRRAARHTLDAIAGPGLEQASSQVAEAVELLLGWRDNHWQEIETLLVRMLEMRDRWMVDFVLSQDPDWDALRERLERPFARAVRAGLTEVSRLLDQVLNAREEALLLARFACSQTPQQVHRELAELAEIPSAPFISAADLEDAHQAIVCLASLVLTKTDCKFRKSVDIKHGFPPNKKAEKARLLDLICRLQAVAGLEAKLGAVTCLPPVRYSDEEWRIVRACFTLLRHAAGQLKVEFAESGTVDFTEVAQIAASVLKAEDGLPTDAALAVADGIRHLLVDEFQDTSRRQHQLLGRLMAGWPDLEDGTRTCFLVGDPMQSIYSFRDADPELFARARSIGLEIPNAEPLHFNFVPLSANFRTVPSLVERLNGIFAQVFAAEADSGVAFARADAAREGSIENFKTLKLHLSFSPQIARNADQFLIDPADSKSAAEGQVKEILALIASHLPAVEQARAAGRRHRIAVLARARKSLTPIAEGLRKAKIPFLAVELEKLSARAEVMDALALGRALLNPEDRKAWLGVLRAPWCGLSLADLHALTSADDPGVMARAIPELLAERLSLLTSAGQAAIRRLLNVLAAEPAVRAAQPTASVGTWLEQIWLRLGGTDCCDAAARVNIDLLWGALDALPEGQPDLLSPALAAALDELTALPDPAASSDCGVQLMTIHKSKGLEFEVVIVPDLHAKTGGNNQKMLAWLERGIAPDADDDQTEFGDEITEFLIAPLPLKGEESGKAKSWIEQVSRTRETEETCRVLYVAATRAREELHMFARPACKVDAAGNVTLATPAAGLLKAAWPAFEEEIRARFEEWKIAFGNRGAKAVDESEIESIAASGAGPGQLFVVPVPVPIAPSAALNRLRRLPEDYEPAIESEVKSGIAAWPMRGGTSGIRSPGLSSQAAAFSLYARQEGGLQSRAEGVAVHALLEELARLRAGTDLAAARGALSKAEPRIAAQIRAMGFDQAQAAQIAASAVREVMKVCEDPVAQWILSPHADAATEVRWSGVIEGQVRTVQADRVFRAGLTPRAEGQAAWWIIDYKTHAEAAGADPAEALPRLRAHYAPQLDAYAQVLRNLHGDDAILRAGLYYPRMQLFDWWEPQE